MSDHRCWPPRPNRQDSPWHCGCGKVWVCDGGHSQWTEVPTPNADAVEIYVWRFHAHQSIEDRTAFGAALDDLLVKYRCDKVASQTGPGTLPVVAHLNALARAEATKETPAVPSCQICGAAMQMVIDMGRVEAGVGGPRPTYMCPDWRNHP